VTSSASACPTTTLCEATTVTETSTQDVNKIAIQIRWAPEDIRGLETDPATPGSTAAPCSGGLKALRDTNVTISPAPAEDSTPVWIPWALGLVTAMLLLTFCVYIVVFRTSRPWKSTAEQRSDQTGVEENGRSTDNVAMDDFSQKTPRGSDDDSIGGSTLRNPGSRSRRDSSCDIATALRSPTAGYRSGQASSNASLIAHPSGSARSSVSVATIGSQLSRANTASPNASMHNHPPSARSSVSNATSQRSNSIGNQEMAKSDGGGQAQEKLQTVPEEVKHNKRQNGDGYGVNSFGARITS
jgi:hypothetical protein